MFVHLSHPLRTTDVAFPGEPTMTVEQDSVISPDGKPFNSVMLHIPNHFATHMDGPKHFNPEGADFDSLPVEKFAYLGDEILLVDLPHKCEPRAIITIEDIEPYAEELKGKRMLLMRTGFEKFKQSDPDLFSKEGLSLHQDLCKWLNEEFPELECIGMDWLSIASPTNDHGVEAHRWLLGNYTDHIILGIEDISLEPVGDKWIKLLTLGPLMVEGVDSTLLGVMAWLED